LGGTEVLAAVGEVSIFTSSQYDFLLRDVLALLRLYYWRMLAR